MSEPDFYALDLPMIERLVSAWGIAFEKAIKHGEETIVANISLMAALHKRCEIAEARTEALEKRLADLETKQARGGPGFVTGDSRNAQMISIVEWHYGATGWTVLDFGPGASCQAYNPKGERVGPVVATLAQARAIVHAETEPGGTWHSGTVR